MYDVPFWSVADGWSVTVLVFGSYDTVALTAEPPDGVTVTFADVIVLASIAWSKVAVTAAAGSTPVAPLTGVVETTCGAGVLPVGVVTTTSAK